MLSRLVSSSGKSKGNQSSVSRNTYSMCAGSSLEPEIRTSSNQAVPRLRARFREMTTESASGGGTAVTVSRCQSLLPDNRLVGTSLSHYDPCCQARCA